MADPVLPPAPPNPTLTNGSAEIYQEILTLRQMFGQNAILIERERHLCTQFDAYLTAFSQQQAMQAQATARAEQAAARSEFLLHVSAFALAFLAGMLTWRLIVLAKNQRHLW